MSEALISLNRELVGDGDRSLMVEELTEDSYLIDDVYDPARLVDAAQTPPFLTEHRVVIGRHLGRFAKADDLTPIVGYLSDPLPTTRLVLVWERGENPRQDRLPSVPKKLLDAVAGCGGAVLSTAIPTGKNASAWLEERLADSSVKFDRGAQNLIAEHFGEDRVRVVGLLHVLEARRYGSVTAFEAATHSATSFESSASIQRYGSATLVPLKSSTILSFLAVG